MRTMPGHFLSCLSAGSGIAFVRLLIGSTGIRASLISVTQAQPPTPAVEPIVASTVTVHRTRAQHVAAQAQAGCDAGERAGQRLLAQVW
jgi:hypothetical protein